MSNTAQLFQLHCATSYQREAVSRIVSELKLQAGQYEEMSDALATFRNTVTNAAQAVKASAGRVYAVICEAAAGSGGGMVHLYNIASGGVTVGTSEFRMGLGIETGETVVAALYPGNTPTTFATAISISASTTSRGSTAITNIPTVTVLYA